MAIEDFVAASVVASGSPTPTSYATAIKALDDFVSNYGPADQRDALNAAQVALAGIGIECSITDAISEEIEHRLERLGCARVRRRPDQSDDGADAP